MSPKTVRVLATVYLAKTLILILLWIAMPDLPHRASMLALAHWRRHAGNAK